MKEPSTKICVMDKESSSTKMEECIKVIGDSTKWTVMANFIISLVKSPMKGTGVKISSKVLVNFTTKTLISYKKCLITKILT